MESNKSYTTLPLTDEQKQVVETGVDDQVLVLAPPGTGKTHTVVARLQYLIEVRGLLPREVLVLCFTRTAVAEIMSRITSLIQSEQMHDDLRFVTVKTFDSYATHLLLADQDEPRNLTGVGYNDRIQLAIDALADPYSLPADIVGGIRHLIVDEIQDVVGVRDRLVRSLLNLVEGGFTLLGDPAQAIYDFADDDHPADGIATTGLLAWVEQQTWPGGLHTLSLTENHRSKGQPAAVASVARDAVLTGNGHGREAYQILQTMLATFADAGSVHQPGNDLKEPAYDSVCVLCRTNGELLQVASQLATQGIPYFIRPRSTEYALPAWVGRVLGTCQQTRLVLPEFEDRWRKLVGDVVPLDPAHAFRWLQHVEGRDSRTLDLELLHRRLYQGHRLPDEADASLDAGGHHVSLSTIHAAKGREFEHVVVLQPATGAVRDPASVDWQSEARVLYVAATRAREALSHLDRQGIPQMMWVETCPGGRRRWVARVPAWNAGLMEMGLDQDLDPASFVNIYLNPHPGDALRRQNMLWSELRPGMQLYFQRVSRGRNRFFHVRPHENTRLEQADFAQLSWDFINDLLHVMSRFGARREPSWWAGVRVARAVTEVLPPFPEKVHQPFARTGLCLGIRVRGMAQINLE